MTARTHQLANLYDAAIADLHHGHPFQILSISSGCATEGAGTGSPSHPVEPGTSCPSSTQPAPQFSHLRLGPPIKAPADPLDHFTSGASHG